MGEACCGNCGEILVGAYCHACGQKRLADGDRRLRHLLGQAVAVATDLDGRFWRSLRALMLQPGRLSRDYLDGKRRHWMTPVGLFLLGNVLYFIAPALTDFNLPLQSQMHQPHSGLTRPWVVQRVAEREREQQARRAAIPEAARADLGETYTLADYAREYDAQSGNVGKALIAVHIPALALGLMLAFRRRRLYFAEHLVVATHQFTFMLLYIQFVVLPSGWLYMQLGRAGPAALALRVALLCGLGAHFTLSLRRVYGCGWTAALLLPVPLMALMVLANIVVYRFLQFALTFAMT